jgi:hypothetical protein
MNNSEKKKIVRMDDQSWRIIDGFGKGTNYSFLLCGTEKAVLIDTGLGFTDMKHITDQLTCLPVEVVNTHGHLDHISRNYQFETAYLHPADKAVFLQHCSYDYRYFLLKGLLAESKLPEWLLKLPIARGQVKKILHHPSQGQPPPAFGRHEAGPGRPDARGHLHAGPYPRLGLPDRHRAQAVVLGGHRL